MRWGRVLVTLSMISGLLLAAVGFHPQPAFAADQVVGGGVFPCTRDGLAGAIAAAATDDPNNPGLVTFNCPIPTITFTNNIQIGIGSETVVVKIDGSNHGTPMTFDGIESDTIDTNFLEIGDNGYVTVEHLTMTNGAGVTGGAIDNDGDGVLVVIDVTFANNEADEVGGAIDNDGTTTVIQSRFIENSAEDGGAIQNDDTLTINQSSFTKNTAQFDGGAVRNDGEIIISQSSFVENQTLEGSGGALDLGNFDRFTVTSSTFSGNTADNGGSAIFAGDQSWPDNGIFWSTIVQPEGTTPAIKLFDAPIFFGVIIGGEGVHCEILSVERLFNATYTFSNDDSCAPDITAIWENQNLLLGPLSTTTTNNVEQTYYPLLEGSPALDSGPASCDTDVLPESDPDQLGYPRPGDGNCSIGAIESNNLPPIIHADDPTIPIVMNEGESVDFAANISDPDNDPIFSTVDCDITDDVPPVSGTTCSYPDNGTFRVRLVVSDGFGSDAVLANVIVNNIIPLMVSIVPSAYVVGVNQPVNIQLTALDTSADTLQFTYNCGVANAITTPFISSTDGTFTTTVVCQFPQPSPYILHVLATDDDGGVSSQIASDPIQVVNFSTLCANNWNGQLRMIDDGGDCSRSETRIEIPADAPLDLCVNQWNGATRADLHHNGCGRGEYLLTVTSSGAIPVCINKWNATIRVTNHCTRSEYADTL